eukprot:COSAG05_NODE_153_length_15894_cov_27.910415_7_plen_49_part_00
MKERQLKSEVKRRAKAAAKMVGKKKEFNTVEVRTSQNHIQSAPRMCVR